LPGSRIVNLIASYVDDQFAVSVKVLEVRRSRVEELGLRWQAQNRYNDGVATVGSGIANAIGQSVVAGLFGTARFTVDRLTLDAFIDFLRRDGSAVLLAEPVILASDGAPARFLAGGELPVPVPFLTAQGGTASLGYTYKPYGVTLAFTGRIMDGDRVRLELAPEVSAVDQGQAVEFAGSRIPAISTRQVETTVVLNFGESVAIAGLRSTDSSRNRRRLPFSTPFGLGDVLAGSRADADSDLELVLIVTPVRAGDAPAQIPALTEPVLPGAD
jgi:pilus assembly protein CpaC